MGAEAGIIWEQKQGLFGSSRTVLAWQQRQHIWQRWAMDPCPEQGTQRSGTGTHGTGAPGTGTLLSLAFHTGKGFQLNEGVITHSEGQN